jgi:hypothetical protein
MTQLGDLQLRTPDCLQQGLQARDLGLWVELGSWGLRVTLPVFPRDSTFCLSSR